MKKSRAPGSELAILSINWAGLSRRSRSKDTVETATKMKKTVLNQNEAKKKK
jgi:hypothetical protein